MPDSPLEIFHPFIRQWFLEKVGTPTDIQKKAWPAIAKGRNVLVTAPTGCGKTLAAFLWGINQLVQGAWPMGALRILYISPLKALNNDVQRNLHQPLFELLQVFSRAGQVFPDIRALTRSGDTPGEERRKMARKPPEILITTPESLNLLLSSHTGRGMLTGISTVILDEIHAVVGTKRGTHLITAVDRLVPLCGEFQRIALSATINPPEKVAEFVGGYRLFKEGKDARYELRQISIIRSLAAKAYDLKVVFPADTQEKIVDGSRWPALIDAFINIIRSHASTLFFANSRRTTEKITRMINEKSNEELAYAHHGSLSKEIRLAVEQKLKNGELRAIVATNSLELGIDIGSLDQVVLIQTPRSVSSTLQRIGRSGHSVGETSRGLLYPTHGRDFVEAAVMARAALEQDIEEIRPLLSPLDILAQVILSMTAMECWDIDDLYTFIRTSYPYRNLPRRHYSLLLEMLAGRYADTRLRELKPRISLDRVDNTVQAQSGVPYLLYSSGGTIPERGYFDMRIQDSRAKIGELDEEFVWERSLGETFTMGSQLWRIEKITHNEVEVTPARSATGIFPFWKAEEQDRDFRLSEKMGHFLEHADRHCTDAGFGSELIDQYAMDEASSRELIEFLKLQKSATGTGLPHRHHLLIENIEEPVSRGEIRQIILHTCWGGRVNRPFGLALSQAWEEQYKKPLQIMVTDDAVLLMLPHEAKAQDVLNLLTPDNVEPLLRRKLEKTGFFGARFRENAERALLLPKTGFKRRMPLWLMRLRAKELLAAVQVFEDFPILIETWRTCLEDEFDLIHTRQVLEELSDGRIRITETNTRVASPFAGHLVWKQTNKYVYEDDTPLSATGSIARQDLIKEILFSPHLRPAIPEEVIRALDQKLKRTAPGYAPGSALELLDWIKERMLVPEPEWKELAAAIRRDHDADAAEWLHENAKKLFWMSWPGVQQPLLASLEALHKVLVAFRLLLEDCVLAPVASGMDGDGLRKRVRTYLHSLHGIEEDGGNYDLSLLLSAWFAYYGPVDKDSLQSVLGVTSERIDEAIRPLIDEQDIVLDRITEGSASLEVCSSENLEILLRMARRYRRPSFQALPREHLALFLASYQGVVPRGESRDDLQQRLEQMFGWPAAVNAWEEYLFPARMRHYQGEWLDALMKATDLIWFGCGPKRISLAFSQDLELYHKERHPDQDEDHGGLDQLIPGRRGKYSFLEIAEYSRLDSVHASERLWKEAWKGRVTSDTFQVIRKGLHSGFVARAFSVQDALPSRRSGFNRWKASRPLEGNWRRIDAQPGETGLLESEGLAKDRVRQVLKRYGVVFRELLANELPALQWRELFRSLRLMEMSGEVLSGYFFEGVPGPQFASHEAFRMLQEPLSQDSVYWINAADPASLCGIASQDLREGLPPRLASTFIVYHGNRIVIIARRLGKDLEIRVGSEDARLADYLYVFKELLNRDFDPLKKISIEAINGEPVLKTHFVDALKRFGFRSGKSTMEMWKEF